MNLVFGVTRWAQLSQQPLTQRMNRMNRPHDALILLSPQFPTIYNGGSRGVRRTILNTGLRDIFWLQTIDN